jgi:Ion channel
MLTVLSIALGAVVVCMVLWDIAVTVLHPTHRGLPSYAGNEAAWRLVRGLSRVTGRRGLLTVAGPAAMATSFLAWVGTLWVGFALIYLPVLDQLTYNPPVPAAERGIADALYLSAVSLSTVGFGDVVAGNDPLRLATAIEGGAGLAVITAAITYLLSVYPLVTRQRAAALRVADLRLDQVEGAAQVAVESGATELAAVHSDLIDAHQDLTRFPVLYYFVPPADNEAATALLRGSAMLCVVLRWGLAPERCRVAAVYGPAYEDMVRRVLDDYDRRYVGGRVRRREQPPPLEHADAAARLERLRAGLGRLYPHLRQSDGGDLDEFATFVGWADSRLTRMAREYDQPYVPLLRGLRDIS